LMVCTLVGVLFILGSCVKDMSNINVPYRRTEEMAKIFFFYLLVVFPCLLLIFLFISVNIEKILMPKEEQKRLNEEVVAESRRALRNDFGILSTVLRYFIKPTDKNKDN